MREQDLVDICFSVAFSVRHSEALQNMSREDLADWVSHKLDKCGFKTKPCGISWGVLQKDILLNLVKKSEKN